MVMIRVIVMQMTMMVITKFHIQSFACTYLVLTRDWILSSLKVGLEPKTQEKPSKVVLSPLTCMTGSQEL